MRREKGSGGKIGREELRAKMVRGDGFVRPQLTTRKDG